MRSAAEISRDLVIARLDLERHEVMNVAGKTPKELEEMHTAYMEAQRRVHQLRAEERNWIES